MLTTVAFDCLRKLPLFDHWSIINKDQINVRGTARYVTDVTVVNKNIYFTFLVITLTLFELRLNRTGDLW